MERLSNPQKTIEIIKKYDFAFQKKFGQNFLIDSHVLDKIVSAAQITKDDCVVEIGPGIGTLTQYLAAAAGNVVAVEIDRALIPILQETLAEYDNVTIIHEDILKVDMEALSQRYNDGKPLKIVANLPYYITTPIIMSLFENHVPVRSITVMVQKEVAERMQAGPGSKEYGALSLAVQYYSKARIVANVPPNCFIPRPNVGSAVICLECCEDGRAVEVSDEKLLFQVIRAAFAQRRKTLANALKNAEGLSLDRETVTEVLREMNLSEMIRGEALTLEQFAELTDRIGEKMTQYNRERL